MTWISLGKNQDVSRLHSSWTHLGTIHLLGHLGCWQNFQFLVVVRLRSLFSCWLSAEGCFQLLKVAALFGSWPPFLSSKPNKGRLRPSQVACLAAARKGSPLLRSHVIKLDYQIIQDNPALPSSR